MKLTVDQVKKRYEKWLKALRSGEYEQCTGALRSGKPTNRSYCCLGVADKVCLKTSGQYFVIRESFALEDKEQDTLIQLNDSKGKSFKYIANYIEKSVLPKVVKRLSVA